MRNVCFVIDNLGYGGTETHLLQVIRGLDRDRIHPHLCLLDGTGSLSRSLEPDDCEVVRYGIKSLASVRTASRLVRFASQLRRWRIDVVQCFFPDSVYFGVMAGKLAGVPSLLKSRRDLFYWVTGAHRKLGRHLDNLYNRFLVSGLVANCDACVQAASQMEKPAPRRAWVISNGVDIPRYSSSRQITGSRDPVRVGILSMLRPEKRVDLLVEAAIALQRQGRDYEYLIAGDGPLADELKRRAAEAPRPDRIRFLGRVSDTPEFLSQIDIGVLCSDTEGQSNSLIEYIVSGKAIVATSVGGNRELVQDGVNGLLTECGSVEQLAAAIDTIGSSPERLRQFAETNISSAPKYSIDSALNQYQELYESFPARESRN